MTSRIIKLNRTSLLNENPNLLSNFLAKIEIGDIRRNGCWNWTGATLSYKRGKTLPYGEFKCKVEGVRKVLVAHRLSYALQNGRCHAPQIRHLCGNPTCVNPSHLAEGNAKLNSWDEPAEIIPHEYLWEGWEQPEYNWWFTEQLTDYGNQICWDLDDITTRFKQFNRAVQRYIAT